MPRAVQYWEEQQEAEMRRRRSAHTEQEAQDRRFMQSHALADEALVSPTSISGHNRATIRCHGASTTASRHEKQSRNKESNTLQLPSMNASSLFEMFSSKNILLRSCTPSLPVDEDESKGKKNSIWSYLDLNDDLYEYDDDLKSRDATDSSEDEDYDSDMGTRKATRRRRWKKTPSPKSSRPPPRDSFRQAYDDLMFIGHGPPAPHATGQNPSQDKHRSTTPNTISSRSSYTHTTTGTTPEPGSVGRPSPTLSQIREDLWGNVPERKHSSNKIHNHGPQSHQSEQVRPSGTISDPRTINSDPVPVNHGFSTSNHSRRGPRVIKQGFGPSQVKPNPGPLRPSQDNGFDPFGLGRSRSQPRNSRGDGSGHVSSTPRISNLQVMGDVYSDHPCQSQNNPNSANANILRRKSFAPSKRDTAPGKPRPTSFGGRPTATEQHTIPQSGSDDAAVFPFGPDFSMFEDTAANGASIRDIPHSSASEEFPTIDFQDGDDTQLSTLSDSDFSAGLDGKAQNVRMNIVKKRSQRNFEMLQRMEQQQQLQQQRNHVPNYMLPRSTRNSTPVSDSTIRTPSPGHSEIVDGTHMYVGYSRFGDHARDVLQLCEHQSLPTINTRGGEVLIKVLASSISNTDCDIRRGTWPSVRLNPYIIPGVAFVGIIHATPEQQKKRSSAFPSNHMKPGEMVMSLVKSGGNARYTSIHKDQLIKVPQHLDPCTMVCLAEMYLTAFQALHHGQRGALRYRNNAFQGQSILVLNGCSCLGRAVIEVALAAGADYCYALAKERQYESIRRLGGIPLPKNPQEWLTLVGRQIHTLVTVTDHNGLYSDPLSPDHLKAVSEDGQVIFVGPPGMDSRNKFNTFAVSSSSSSIANPSKLICKSSKNSLMKRFHAYNVHDSFDADPRLAQRDLEHLVGLLEVGRLRPDVLERVPLSKVAKVHSILETKKVSGYIVCLPWMSLDGVPPAVTGSAAAAARGGTPPQQHYHV